MSVAPAGERVGPSAGSARRSKRFLDVVGASALIVVSSPVLAVAAVAIRLTSGPSVLFRQQRVGLGRRPFTMVKFRTMRPDGSDEAHRRWNEAELLGELDPGDGLYKDQADPRITPVGRILRRYSIDELPQLWNVIRGDMSLVGPRPSQVWEADLFPEWADDRYLVRPGLTGLWQVSGRSRLSLPEMLALDVRYVHEWSWTGDLEILARTPRAALSGEAAA
jgi:lipopolysaccharide/colanic/teichoic acid biosynthesis glycosyltransferase